MTSNAFPRRALPSQRRPPLVLHSARNWIRNFPPTSKSSTCWRPSAIKQGTDRDAASRAKDGISILPRRRDVHGSSVIFRRDRSSAHHWVWLVDTSRDCQRAVILAKQRDASRRFIEKVLPTSRPRSDLPLSISITSTELLRDSTNSKRTSWNAPSTNHRTWPRTAVRK